ncbi:MAG: thiamine pyrophosphate-binding protein [Rhodospirillaceae bacterium]|jgi:thiamine pyrophosphate-dependent acetolactate synthase large subunit-like protein|nr:thiamine pyrophosphate-binding protein [Rhodospirillaceae bacterium]MBT4043750.1 thiamine pyrophosphate-binding protein [Rhodospirillaceae bacterium]MBT4689279.1 thiamine pyrophosphate-binding protein [Rhodospirillaceae bacterium]MBT5079352.1 thiamine pyrophosphate-binding protein [Rhodospirillaceae bacterium]MBT5525828.1 thiamine pyrophosphate-binding protein [Rhodospirillaceae bacterium]
MAQLNGSEILAKALKREGVDELFFLMGGPMLAAEAATINEGIRCIDVRHEQAAAMMAQAYSRLQQRPGVCMAASGPATINLSTGLANALIDCCPVVALGGAGPVSGYGRQVFQEIDQMEIMSGCVKYAARVHDARRIPEMLNVAMQRAMSGKPGPVYLDLPGDVLYQMVDEDKIDWSPSERPILGARPPAPQAQIDELAAALAKAERPVLLSGSGVIWSQAWEELHALVDATGIPFYTTPQGRGVVPEDHPCCFPAARSTAFRDADLIAVVGTRLNYIVAHLAPPRFSGDATIARIDIDVEEIAGSPRHLDIGIVADAKTALGQLNAAIAGKVDPSQYDAWRKNLAEVEASKRAGPGSNSLSDAVPIHPLRLCEEVKNFMDRDAILVVDGQEILNYGRQSMPTYAPGHRLNSGPFGTMGVGLPFGLGAKVAKPDTQVIVVHGDGSFGLNAMELDTAVRHNIPVLVVISLNGGWTADPTKEKPGRDLGYTRYDKMAEALGCYSEYVEEPGDIAAALARAQAKVDDGMVAVVNVKTDWAAQAVTQKFATYST